MPAPMRILNRPKPTVDVERRADAVCAEVVPSLREIADGQFAACHHPLV